MTWVFIFLFITFLLFLLPVIPALMELILPTDTQPLRVVQEYDTDITHFAMGFKAYLEKNFGSFFAAADTSEFAFQEGVLRDGTNFQVVKTGGAPTFAPKELNKSATQKLVLAFSPLVLPDNMFFETEVYSYGTLTTGNNSHFRALLAEDAINIAPNCTVLRWVHSGTDLSVGAACSLFGRASAAQTISIGENCQFERMNAPTIVFGKPTAAPTFNAAILRKTLDLPNVKDIYEGRWVVNGDLDLPVNSLFDGDLIASKKMFVGQGSHITGSLKSNKDMHIATGTRIDGAVFSSGSLYIESGCQIAGPVIAESTLFVERGTVIGTPAVLTSVSAPRIVVSGGVVMHGTIWADETAIVAAPSAGRV
ncbi:MAG: hypothetical protein EBR02_01025 [Alphaproteobacteria bacterium]|nr:hypothetical protein [Alphaproteobacteria bacterium]